MRRRLVVQGSVRWLEVKILTGGVDSKLLCAVDEVEMRVLESSSETWTIDEFKYNGAQNIRGPTVRV